jgi:pseudouridylate synthase I
MQRYFIRFSYDGTNYHGWQIQPGDVSVQEVMTERMRCVLGKDLTLTAAGRTDAGVHASNMTAHFDTERPIEDPAAMVSKLNTMMPADICVCELRPVRAEAHARFDALSRTYEYRISLKKDPFKRQYTTRLFSCPDVEAMNRAATALFDYSDFTSFSKLHTDVKTNNCRIMKAFWKQDGDSLVFTIQADRFLRNMVRAIVGTMLEVGRHKIDEADFRKIIESKDRCEAGISVPAQGLFLTEVSYPEDIYI